MTQKEKILLQFSEKKNVSVELGLIDDFNSISSKAVNSGSDAGANAQDWLNKKNPIIIDLKNSLKDQQNVIDLATR